jgi:fructokinase
MTILAYLGWQTYPMATLGEDLAAAHILEDLKRFGVNASYLQRSAMRRTPIVVEKIRTRGFSVPRHRFVWTCPNCGSWLPGYQAVLATEAREIAKTIPLPNVFFFDRVSRGALELAHASAKRGALVIFEPSGVRDERLFLEAVEVSHILKYSHERFGHLREISGYVPPFLEIETLGGAGLRYRMKGNRTPSRWREMEAYSVNGLRDTAGAGDWCTAGLLHRLAIRGIAEFKKATKEEIEKALRLGQALAAVKCRYEGPRGVMYMLTKNKFEAAVTRIFSGNFPTCAEEESKDADIEKILETICPSCDKQDKKQIQRRKLYSQTAL